MDGSVLRRPHTGVARYLIGLADGLRQLEDVEVRELPGPRRIGNGKLFRPLNLARQRWWYDHDMPRQALRLEADVMFMPAGYTCRRGPIPQLVTIHDVNFLTQPGTYESSFAAYARWAYRRAAREADGIVTDSEFSRGEIARHLDVDPARIRVVYPGLDVPQATDATPPIDEPYALYVGATEQHKNVGLLLDAWQQRSPDLTLAIVGSPGRQHRDVLARAATIGRKVIVTGRVPLDQLEAWYAGAQVFLFPSRAEGFGFPPLEAMARGIPVVATRAGSLPEVLGDAALYSAVDDPVELMTRVETILNDETLRRDLIARGRSRAATYTWSSAARETRAALAAVARA